MRGRRSKERELWEDMERERHNGGLLARRSGEEIDRGWMWRKREEARTTVCTIQSLEAANYRYILPR